MELSSLGALSAGLAQLCAQISSLEANMDHTKRLGWAPLPSKTSPMMLKDHILRTILEAPSGASKATLLETISPISRNPKRMLPRCLNDLRNEGLIVCRKGVWLASKRSKRRQLLDGPGQDDTSSMTETQPKDNRMTQLDHAIIAMKLATARRQVEEVEQLIAAAHNYRGAPQAPATATRMTDRIRALLCQAPHGLNAVELAGIIQPLSDRPKESISQTLSRLKKAGEISLIDKRWFMNCQTVP